MMKKFFYFMLKTFRTWDIYIFVQSFQSCLEFSSYKKATINFKICRVTDWTTNNYYTDIVQYLKK